MNRFLRLTQLVGVTSVPVLGVTWAGWTNATALVLYWWETLILVLLVAARIHIHRIATKKRGHYCEIRMNTTTNGATKTRTKIGYYGTSFLVFSIAFWIGRPVEMVNASDRPLMVLPLRVAAAITLTGVGMVPEATVVLTLPLLSLVALVGRTVRPPVNVVALKLTVTPANPLLF